MKAIEIQEVSKSFGTVKALNKLSLSIGEGELFGLIGPDGAGKTTLIRILSSLLFPDEGWTSVLGLSPVKNYVQLRQKVGYMPGRFSLYQDLSVEENLGLFASIFETTIDENYHLIEDIYVQIEPFRTRRAGALSGGMKQKLALCCAMIHKPDILFLDEPTTGVDPVSRKEFWMMLRKLNEDGLTILVSTPYMDEASQCETIALIQHGEILATASPVEICENFRYPLFSIKGPSNFDLLKVLRQEPMTHSVYSFGDAIHFSSKEDINKVQIEEALQNKGLDSFEIKKIEPGIEDTFMELMR